MLNSMPLNSYTDPFRRIPGIEDMLKRKSDGLVIKKPRDPKMEELVRLLKQPPTTFKLPGVKPRNNSLPWRGIYPPGDKRWDRGELGGKRITPKIDALLNEQANNIRNRALMLSRVGHPIGGHGSKKGGSILSLIGKSLGFWKDYAMDWHKDKKHHQEMLDVLNKAKEKYGKAKGGKFQLQDVKDFFLGPPGWFRMGFRKKREREIEALKKELGL